MGNCSNGTETIFHILTFSTSETEQYLFLAAILLMYLTTVLGNMTIATLVCLVPKLQTPMYFFLSNLAVVDVIYVSVTLPKLISILLTRYNRMSFSACKTQIYFFSLSAAGDIYVLTIMAYNPYVAICKPLQYFLLMSKDVCIALALGSWLFSGINAIINVIVTSYWRITCTLILRGKFQKK